MPRESLLVNNPLYRSALITGASSGIGAEFARQLARQGTHLFLVARRLTHLENLAHQLENQYRIHARPLQADLSTEAGVAKVEAYISQQSDLDLLVNNAGNGLRGFFYTDPIQKHLDLIHIQINASIRLARAALDGMLQRNHGAIINVSSMAAFVPVRNVTYSAVKAFLINFSEALQSELYGRGIKVQALCPGFVKTEFHDTPELARFNRSAIPMILWLSAEETVHASLQALKTNQVVCIPSWRYKLIAAFARLPLSVGIVRWTARQLVFHNQAY